MYLWSIKVLEWRYKCHKCVFWCFQVIFWSQEKQYIYWGLIWYDMS